MLFRKKTDRQIRYENREYGRQVQNLCLNKHKSELATNTQPPTSVDDHAAQFTAKPPTADSPADSPAISPTADSPAISPAISPTANSPANSPADSPTANFPSSTNNKPDDYLLLRSLGVTPNFDNSDNSTKISNLLSELVCLYRNKNKEMSFTYPGNCKPGIAIVIPKSKDYNSFDKSQRRLGWLKKIFDFISGHKHSTLSNEDSSTWLLQYLYKEFPQQFIKISIEKGLVISQQMNEIEAAAMWAEANVSYNQARIILKHLYSKFKMRLQVPFTRVFSLSKLGSNDSQPIFGEYLFNKNSSNKPSEHVQYWTYCPSHLLELDFTRLISSKVQNCSSSPTEITYGYKSKVFSGGNKGVICVIGADHGGGKSRYLIRTNYLSSSSRQKENKVNHGCLTVQFAEMQCKKDTHELQALIAPTVNSAIKNLNTSMLVGIQSDQDEIKCVLVPTNARGLRTRTVNQNLHLVFDTNAKEQSINLKLKPSTKTTVWIVIESFKVVIAGDLSFFATAMGRDGHSHCRCPYCDMTPSTWSDSAVKGNPLTLPLLCQYASIHDTNPKANTKGVVMQPQIQMDPKFFILPLLHLLIGIVNKAWTSMAFFFDEFVENVSDIEASLKDDILLLEKNLENLKEEIDIETANKNMACMRKNFDSEATEIYQLSLLQIEYLQEERKKINS